MIVGESLTLGSENQTGLVERVATEHAADRIGDDLLDDISRHEFVTLGRRVLRVCECWITFQRHSFDRYVAWHFIAHTVGVRHEFVVLDFTLTLLFSDMFASFDICRNDRA